MIFCWNYEVYPKSNLGQVLVRWVVYEEGGHFEKYWLLVATGDAQTLFHCQLIPLGVQLHVGSRKVRNSQRYVHSDRKL